MTAPEDGIQHERSLLGRLRAYFLAGLLLTAPLAVTIGVAIWFVDLVDSRVLPAGFRVPGLGLVIVISAITLLGWFASGFIGRLVAQIEQWIVSRIPVVRSVYGATKQVVESVLAQKSGAFREVALFEYPRRGVWSIGFLTGTTAGEVQHRTQEETVNVFLPTTPNPTSGYLLFVPRRDLIILDMTVEDALEFFDAVPRIKQKLQTLNDVGLGYIHLGQSATTLSGGEAQRVKLATELSKRSTGNTLYILDEPTTGLHFEDVRELLNVLHQLVDRGNTVIVMEHNLQVVKTADWVIDLGPEGGDGGGRIVVEGAPETIAAHSASYTGQHLAPLLASS